MGPSILNLDPKGFTATLPACLFLFPSIVVMSIIEEIRPPYTAEKPPVYISADLIISVSKTEKKPIE